MMMFEGCEVQNGLRVVANERTEQLLIRLSLLRHLQRLRAEVCISAALVSF